MSTAFSLTDEQRVAVTTTGKSILVSAAAGSGKTTVLAERCAYLVCDAPVQDRCDVDQLLVLTFTDAAATQMRSRIIESLRARSQVDPGNVCLQEQVLRAETAQISTIHSFCLWIIRRWFHGAETDPMASVLDAQEAAVLKQQVLEELFERRYSRISNKGPLLGEDLLDNGDPKDLPSNCKDGSDFVNLIEVYGLGEDHGIAAFVSRLYEFTTSLPDPNDWLNQAASSLLDEPEWALDALKLELESELRLQSLHCEELIKTIEAGDPCCQDHADRVRAYVRALEQWRTELHSTNSSSEGLDRIRERIRAFAFDTVGRPRNLSESQKAAREAAKQLSDEVKKLFDKRIKERFGHFTSAEWLAGMATTGPFVATLVDLVKDFSAEYAARKRRLNVLDFSDLERKAYELVRDLGHDTPSRVATAIRNRFAHILVDEFQDINPIQQAILEAVSRERDSNRSGNLFAVGDVKQSIYRFRLAEPEIFLRRLESGRASAGTHAKKPPSGTLFLQNNFRSRPEILGAVNFVYRHLMTGDRQGLIYDDNAELRSGLPAPPEGDHVPVEVHILERRMTGAPNLQTAENEDDDMSDSSDDSGTTVGERGVRPGTHPSRWDAIEREACLIGMHIRSLTQQGPESTANPVVQLADIAVLLRSTKINADLVAGVLTSMGIPAHAQVGGSLLNVLEVREVIAALQVLDNVQQDIPLAGVLRSGIFGDRFEEDELVEIRLIDRFAPFHATVTLYAQFGPDAKLRERIAEVLARISRYRDDVVRRPLAQTVWNLLERQGYMAYCSGLPNTAQRRANLLKLYDLAHRFSSHQRQGLHRFLQFVESLADGDQSIAVAPASGALDNVVRIMSIHQAKGMEFPVVFVAGLGNEFNLGDRNGRMIFERESRIGLRAIDTVKMLEYPTAVHQLVASEVERSARDEELRVLYVAMTRAMNRLILLGSMNHVGNRFGALSRAAHAPTALRIATARSPLDWLVPVLGSAAPDLVCEPGKSAPQQALFQVALHEAAEMETWLLGPDLDSDQQKTLDGVSALQSLPECEPAGSLGSQADQTLDRIHRMYPWLEASSIGATWAASDFPIPFMNARQPEWPPNAPETSSPWSRNRLSRDEATERGILTHRALEHINFDKATDAQGISSELGRIVSEGILSDHQRNLVMEEGIAWFAATPLADLIRRAKANYHREFRFVTLEPLRALDLRAHVPEDDRVLVRGIVDGIVVRDGACEIIDFKTDAVTEADLQSRCETYRAQVQVYARAMERLWRLPVTACWLVFLSRKQLVQLDLAPLAKTT